MTKIHYELVIETDKYTGNFERQFCAFTTGMTGECGVGEEYAEVFQEEVTDEDFKVKLGSIILDVPDDNGCHRPVAVNEDNSDALSIFFSQPPTFDQLTFIFNRGKKFAETAAKIDPYPQSPTLIKAQLFQVKAEKMLLKTITPLKD